MSPRRLAGLAGVLGPSLFVLTFTVEGWFRPGYRATEMFISALSLGASGWIQIINFIVLGTAFLLFTRGVAAEFPSGKASRAGPILLAIIGACFLASGPCVMDPVDALTKITPRDQMTWHGVLHGIFGALVFSLSPVSCFVFFRRFRREPLWQAFCIWTCVTGALSALFVVLLSLATKPPFAPNVLTGWVGAIQRAALVTFLAWIVTFASKLLVRKE